MGGRCWALSHGRNGEGEVDDVRVIGHSLVVGVCGRPGIGRSREEGVYGHHIPPSRVHCDVDLVVDYHPSFSLDYRRDDDNPFPS